MDLNDLSMFIEAVRAGSLSAAARRLGAPLATVSRRVRALEAQLDIRLVERGRLGLKTTPAGQRLFEQASPGLAQAQDSARAVRDASGIAGWLRVSLPPTFEPWWRLVSEFRAVHPLVKFDIFTSERRVDLVADGIDVALRIGDVARADYVGRRLASYRHQLVATPAFLARHRVARVNDVLEVPCAGFRSGPDAVLAWRLGDRVVQPTPVLLANDYAHLRAAALAGEVLTELPPFLVDARLVRVLPRSPFPEVTVMAVVPERRHTSALVRAYIDFCVTRAPALLGQ
ncbi:MAG: LysR substrate-binding domain-containing protein [Archangium sp.]|nr:LysR substrate-binding domain-containing protein [Archangium sp.]MDP3151918.1 LysR substrate-binding domain-containing protein [Archangium sp.]MDP3571331.1 LysR substrate-binding domain-containing protein [Archangium sp.]